MVTILSYMSSTFIRRHLPESFAPTFMEASNITSAATGGDSGPQGILRSFAESINKDLAAISSLMEGLDPLEVKEFVDVVEKCEGQVVLSGMGKDHHSNRFCCQVLVSIITQTGFYRFDEFS